MKTIIRAGAVLLVLFLLLTVSAAAIPEGSVTVPGGTASNAEELKTALGGEVYIKDKTVTLKSDLILSAPLMISGGEYILNGAGCSIGRGDFEGDMITLEHGANLFLGKEKREGNDIILSVVGSDKENESERLFCVRDGAILTMNAGVVMRGSRGGAVVCESGGTFSMKEGSITSCGSSSSGGGVLVREGGLFTLEGGTIEGNRAENGGNVAVLGGTAGFVSGTVKNGTASKNGGGIYMDGTAVFGAVSVTGNKAEKGGGLYLASCTEIGGGTVRENSAILGGGVYSEAKGLVISRLGIEACRAERGGGFYNTGDVRFGDVFFSLNVASSCAGGMYNSPEGRVSLDGLTVGNNESPVAGGIWNDGEITSVHCSLMANRGDVGTAMVNCGTVILRDNSFISPRNTVCVAVNAGEGKGSITYDGVLAKEYPCFVPVTRGEDGALTPAYSSKVPMILGTPDEVAKAAKGSTVLPDHGRNYKLTSSAVVKQVFPLPLLIGICALGAAVIGAAVVLIVKKKA